MTDEFVVNKRQLAGIFANAMSRFAMAQTAFEGDRKYYDILGYKTEPNFDYYNQRYRRQDICKTLVDLPAKDTWKKPPFVGIAEQPDSEFELAWKTIVKKTGLYGKISRADRMSGIYRFGVLVLGVSGVADEAGLKEPIKPKQLSGPQDLLYLTPLSERYVKISTYEKDTTSERYNLPLIYKVLFNETKIDDASAWVDVHHTRILHFAEDKTDSEVFGTPRLEAVLNRIDDLMKIVGGGSEATWLSMRKGTILSVKDGYDATNLAKTDVYAEIEAFLHDQARMLYLDGIEGQDIGQDTVIRAKEPFDIIIDLICAATRIPRRKLIGSAAGELSASREDTRQWAGEIAQRQQTYAEPEILRPFIDWCIWAGILPDAEYQIGKKNPQGDLAWPVIIETTDEEDAEIGVKRSQEIKNYSDPNAVYPITDDEIRKELGYPALAPLDKKATKLQAQSHVIGVLRVATENYKAGKIDIDQYLEAMQEVVRDTVNGD